MITWTELRIPQCHSAFAQPRPGGIQQTAMQQCFQCPHGTSCILRSNMQTICDGGIQEICLAVSTCSRRNTRLRDGYIWFLVAIIAFTTGTQHILSALLHITCKPHLWQILIAVLTYGILTYSTHICSTKSIYWIEMYMYIHVFIALYMYVYLK